MNNNAGFMGGLYAISEWIMKFSMINLFWILFNIPIVFLLLNLLFIEQIEAVTLFIDSCNTINANFILPCNDRNVWDGERLDY